MAYNICIIDDDFPTKFAEVAEFGFIDEGILNSTDIRLMSNRVENWNDINLKILIGKLSEQNGVWDIIAFKAPEFFLNHLEKDILSPDVIIFDWDYPGERNGQFSTENNLYEIIQNSYCIISVFSGADKEHEILEIFEKEKFTPFRERLNYLSKTSLNSAEILVTNILERTDTNFSFKFGKRLTKNAFDSISKILIDLGKVTMNQTLNYFKITHDTKRDLIDFIGERYKSHLADFQFDELNEINQIVDGVINEGLAKELWSYRLYHYARNENDNLVRKGDIIKSEDDKLFFVVSADCELANFWKKNYGHINLVPLHRMNNGNEFLKNKLTNTKSPSQIKNNFTQSSITNNIHNISEGPLIFPFIKIENIYGNYLCFPKEILNIKIPEPTGLSKADLSLESLKYSSFTGYERICMVTEPFLTPIITHLFNSVFGYGTPDYPDVIQNIIKNESKALFE